MLCSSESFRWTGRISPVLGNVSWRSRRSRSLRHRRNPERSCLQLAFPKARLVNPTYPSTIRHVIGNYRRRALIILRAFAVSFVRGVFRGRTHCETPCVLPVLAGNEERSAEAFRGAVEIVVAVR